MTPPAVSAHARKKIAFIHRGAFSHTNSRVLEQLTARFPEHEIEEIDVARDLLRHHETFVFRNVLEIARCYRRELLSQRKTLQLAFYRTPYIFQKIRELIRARLEPQLQTYAFSVQTQSLFDASVSGLPHFIYTDHTHLANLSYPGFTREQLFSRRWIDLEQEAYRRATHVFTMSGHVRDSLIVQYAHPPHRVTVIGAGSNTDSAPVELKNENYANQRIVFVGVNWERKGGATLLMAFEKVAEHLPDARLVIAGSSPAVAHPRVEVIGRVTREEVRRQLARASVFCLPTRVEPFGIAVVEALHQALPVVTTSIGAMPDLVAEGETGLLVPPDDAAALATALFELLSDPEKCRRFGERGRAFVQQHYTWDAVGEKLRAGIDAALARTSAETGHEKTTTAQRINRPAAP